MGNSFAVGITVSYASIYSFGFLIAATVGAYTVYQQLNQHNKKSPPTSRKHGQEKDPQKHARSTKTANNERTSIIVEVGKEEEQHGDGVEQKYEEDDDKKDASSGVDCKKFCYLWYKELRSKKSVYLLVVPHVFDQATDVGAIYEYWSLLQEFNAKNATQQDTSIDPFWFFVFSIVVFVFQRVISALLIYFMTNRNWKAAFMQIFDVLLMKAVWVNYVLGLKKPCNPQIYVELLECVFESAPQLMLSTGFTLKLVANGEQPSGFIVFQTLFSLFSLTSKIAADDKAIFTKQWQEFVVEDEKNKKICLLKRKRLNPWYLLRVLGWRFLEITSRILTLIMLWMVIGGLSLLCLIAFELTVFAIFCMFKKNVSHAANVLYVVMVDEQSWIPFACYRVAMNLVLLISTTIAAMVAFDAKHIPDPTKRRALMIETDIGMAILVYSWIAAFVWPCILFRIGIWRAVDWQKTADRGILEYLKASRLKEALQLVYFGVLMKKDLNADDTDYLKQRLRSAASQRELEWVRFLTQFAVNIEAEVDVEANTALILAASSGHAEVTRFLIQSGANIDAVNTVGATALMMAVRGGHIEVTRLLVQSAANIDVAAKDGMTALMFTRRRDAKIARLLIESGANIEAVNEDGMSTLMSAARYGHGDIVRLLTEFGANTEVVDEDGMNALMFAARYDHIYITRQLIESGANIDAAAKYGMTALMLAARYGHAGIARFLIKSGANIEAVDEYGVNALMFAARYDHIYIAELLIESEADIDLDAMDKYGRTALMMAYRDNHMDIAKLLSGSGANINLTGKGGQTALMFATGSGNEEATRALIQAGANVDVANEHGWTALMVAVVNHHKGATKMLVEAGANVNAVDIRGQNALMLVAQDLDFSKIGFDSERAVRLFPVLATSLIEYGVNVNAVDKDGMTVLMKLVEHSPRLWWARPPEIIIMIRVLLRLGADIEIVDTRGKRARDWYAGHNTEILRLLGATI